MSKALNPNCRSKTPPTTKKARLMCGPFIVVCNGLTEFLKNHANVVDLKFVSLSSALCAIKHPLKSVLSGETAASSGRIYGANFGFG
jgi:antibiotic biosynthesis monooxygenase (ABM) superfamily enzyme